MPRGVRKNRENVTDMMVNSMQFKGEIDKSGLKEDVPEPTAQIMSSQKSSAKRIFPNRSIPVRRKSPVSEQSQKEKEHGWVYVEGVYENRFSPGETITLWINPFPGDAYAEWTIPCNIPIQIPRWLAKHLNERKYVEFKYKDSSGKKILQSDDFMETFEPDSVKHRMSFIATNQY